MTVARLKGVVFGIRDVLARQGKVDKKMLGRIGKLVQFLAARGIEVAAVSNSSWFAVGDDPEDRTPLPEFLHDAWGVEVRCFVQGQDGFPAKQSSAALEQLRKTMKWAANEMLYVGNSEDDMRSAVNGGTLFLNALWYGDNTRYGFRFDSPQEIARFIDVFCLREHWWYFAIEERGLRVFALAPFSTYADVRFKTHSEDFIRVVKNQLGDQEDVEFWAKYLCTSLYFSGVYADVNYITPYPRHLSGTYPSVLEEPMAVFARCFRGKFIPDLIVRHTNAIESKKNRRLACHDEQLKTIHLNPRPLKKPDEQFAKSPLGRGKTVLVLDDVITEGYSCEAARTLIELTGSDVVCVGLLKTLNRDYHRLKKPSQLVRPQQAYEATAYSGLTVAKDYGYQHHIVDGDAAAELSERLKRYQNWTWPDE